jgi:hypothetical protein
VRIEGNLVDPDDREIRLNALPASALRGTGLAPFVHTLPAGQACPTAQKTAARRQNFAGWRKIPFDAPLLQR